MHIVQDDLNRYDALYGEANQTIIGFPDERFFLCFRHQSCDACLRDSQPCSWCETSQACILNDRPAPIFTPIFDQNVCPMSWREKWEMRAKPFSCRCSSMTFVASSVSVLVTLLSLLLIWVLVRFAIWGRRKWRKRQPDWYKIDKEKWKKRMICARKAKPTESSDPEHSERSPLLVET